MIWSVNSTYSAMRRVSRSAITDGPRGRRCVDTPSLGTLRHSRTPSHHQPTNTHQRSRATGTRTAGPPKVAVGGAGGDAEWVLGESAAVGVRLWDGVAHGHL